jgi:hypothetical protein
MVFQPRGHGERTHQPVYVCYLSWDLDFLLPKALILDDCKLINFVGLSNALAKRLSIVGRVLGKNDFQNQHRPLHFSLYYYDDAATPNRTIR